MSEWHLKSSDSESGPYTLDELRFLQGRNQIAANAQVRKGRTGSWMPIDKVLPRARAPKSNSVDLRKRSSPPTETAARPPQEPIVPQVTPPIFAPIIQPRQKRPTDWLVAGGILALLLIAGVVLFLLVKVLATDAPRGPGVGSGVTGSGEQGDEDAGTSGSKGETGTAGAQAALDSDQEESEMPPTLAENHRQPTPDSPPAEVLPPTPAPSVPRPRTDRRSRFMADDLSELNNRLGRESAKSGDVQVSLMWNNRNDLDLYVVSPKGEEIFFRRRQSSCGGMLDVDMNYDRMSEKPVENVFWPMGKAPHGRYRVYVHLFAVQGGEVPTSFVGYTKLVNKPAEPFRGDIQTGNRLLVSEFDY